MSTKFEIDGKTYYFNFDSFRRIYTSRQKSSDLKKSDYENNLAKTSNVSPQSIHAYFYKNNGPGDLSVIKAIADYWNIDFKSLLKEQENDMPNKLNDREKEAVRRIYSSICDFMEFFIQSDGIFSVLPDGSGPVPDYDGSHFLNYSYDKVLYAHDREYVDLHNHPIYDELYNFIYDDLNEMYDGKCSGSVRYEPEEEGGIPAQIDYDIAREKILKILDKYT